VGLEFPRDAVEIQQIRENLFARMRETAALEAGRAGWNDPIPGELESGLELELGVGGGRQQALLDQALGAHGALDQLDHLFGVEQFGIQSEIKEFRRREGATELAFARGALGGFQLAEELPGRGAIQAAVQHESADAAGLRGDHPDAKHPQEMPEEVLHPGGADNQVVLCRQPGQDRQEQVAIGFVGDLDAIVDRRRGSRGVGRRPKRAHRMRGTKAAEAAAEFLRGNTGDIFVSASRLAGDGDQTHSNWWRVTSRRTSRGLVSRP